VPAGGMDWLDRLLSVDVSSYLAWTSCPRSTRPRCPTRWNAAPLSWTTGSWSSRPGFPAPSSSGTDPQVHPEKVRGALAARVHSQPPQDRVRDPAFRLVSGGNRGSGPGLGRGRGDALRRPFSARRHPETSGGPPLRPGRLRLPALCGSGARVLASRAPGETAVLLTRGPHDGYLKALPWSARRARNAHATHTSASGVQKARSRMEPLPTTTQTHSDANPQRLRR